MKREVSLGELLAAAIVVVSCVLAFWINTEKRLTALEIQYKSSDDARTEMMQKLDKIINDITDVKVNLQNKKDK